MDRAWLAADDLRDLVEAEALLTPEQDSKAAATFDSDGRIIWLDPELVRKSLTDRTSSNPPRQQIDMKTLSFNKKHGLDKAAKLLLKRGTRLVLRDSQLRHVNGTSENGVVCTSGEYACTRLP